MHSSSQNNANCTEKKYNRKLLTLPHKFKINLKYYWVGIFVFILGNW